MKDKSSLLDMALNSLKVDSSADKRQAIMRANQQAIVGIGQKTATVAGNLEVKQSINGEFESNFALPLKYTPSFEVDLNKMILPETCGKGSLREAIQRLCNEHNIQIDAKINTATFTTVVTVLAGHYAENDTEFADVCKAEFVPVLKSTNGETRALVLCYSLNGATKLRVDNIKFSGSMSCLGRESGASTALEAIEIPNLIAFELQGEQPELFKQLQKNACILAVVEYDLIQPQNQSFNMRGGSTRGGDSNGISAYSVIGQGSQAQDRSISIRESGERKLKKIQVYNIGALVVNTNLQELSASQCNNIAQLMQERAIELGGLYASYKTYTYENFIAEMTQFMQKYLVNPTTSILEHAFLALGAIEDNPTTCKHGPSQKTPQYFFVDYGLPADSVKKLVANLQSTFGGDFCQFTPEFNQNGLFAVRFSLELVQKNIVLLQKKVEEILSEPRNLVAYQRYARLEDSLYNGFTRKIENLVYSFGFSISKSDCFELIFLKIFGCQEECNVARFQPGASYVGKMMDTHFFLNISETAARAVVERINNKSPNMAQFIRSDAHIADKGSIALREIAVNTGALNNTEFLEVFKNTITNLIEDEPLFIEQLKIQSGTQGQSSKQYSDKLKGIADSYKSDKYEPKLKLGEALSQFTVAITDKAVKKSERLAASDSLRRAIGFFESTQTGLENKQFKQSDKQTIKEAQKALGLYKW
ncbi:MAG: hypothetical protein WC627_11285 [Legionella sp.]|jgi:hypothetical protein